MVDGSKYFKLQSSINNTSCFPEGFTILNEIKKINKINALLTGLNDYYIS